MQEQHGRTSMKAKEHPLYRTWKGIVSRCTNPNSPDWKDYGGRGIHISTDWRTFWGFLKDVGERPSNAHSVDRKDNDGHYCKSNFRWATHREQQANRRDNVWVVWLGKSMIAAEFARCVGLPRMTVIRRLRLGWTIDRIAATPNTRHQFKARLPWLDAPSQRGRPTLGRAAF